MYIVTVFKGVVCVMGGGGGWVEVPSEKNSYMCNTFSRKHFLKWAVHMGILLSLELEIKFHNFIHFIKHFIRSKFFLMGEKSWRISLHEP